MPELLLGLDVGAELEVGFVPITSTDGIANVAAFYNLAGQLFFLDGPYQP